MNIATENISDTTKIKFPIPPDKFGQDGNFYRCYDSLAQELDDDMTNGLKEQLNTILVFTGLFAGVNTAFLALTLPLLSSDPTGDTNALLAQSNALLMQLVSGRNDTTSVDPTLPSAAFSPSYSIFTINALFALSLTLAIISSFLTVIGLQWLVYYRERSGGGPDYQRWQQLQRFLGAEQWHLETILEDILPLFLQIGLIIFCVSLVLYLRYLSPALSLVVGLPFCGGLAVFIGTALCTLWDKYCPIHSSLSHLLLRAVHSLLWVIAKWKHAVPSNLPLPEGDRFKRMEKTIQSLQAIALRRAICISDDPATLLYSAANIPSIETTIIKEQLWASPAFRQRFLEIFQNFYDVMSHFSGRVDNPRQFTESARHLYCVAAAHILLSVDSDHMDCSALWEGIAKFDAAKVLMSYPTAENPTSISIRSTLGLFTLRCIHLGRYQEQFDALGDYLISSSEYLAGGSDLASLSFSSWMVCWYTDRKTRNAASLEKIAQAYTGYPVGAMETVEQALTILLQTKSRKLFDCDAVLTNMLQGVERVLTYEQANLDVNAQQGFRLLESCEEALRRPRLLPLASQIREKLRLNVAEIWRREYVARRANN
ncbi:hypothetical protein FRC00_013732 [Tulasnella sp. 408]|nr:hypothetical protein FRC00_013732 [Tulasnella sp. 408]